MNKKKLVSYIITFVLIIGMFGVFAVKDVHAEDVAITIGLTPAEVKVGDTVTATVTISGDALANYSISLQYSSGILQYQSEAGNPGSISISGTGGTTVNYTFKAVADGRASINTAGEDLYDATGAKVSVAHAGAVLTVGGATEATESTEEDTETTEEKTEEKQEEDDGRIKIGNDYYTFVNEFHLPTPPKDYVLSYVKYKDKDIFAYKAPNQNIKVVCLQNADYEQKWFAYDEKTERFSPFVEYSLEGVSYVVIDKPSEVELPAGFSEAALTLKDMQLTAYVDDSNSGLYLVYALNQMGFPGFYYYDTNEGSFTRYEAVKAVVDMATATNAAAQITYEQTTTEVPGYATPLIADKQPTTPNPEDEGLLSRETYKKLLTMMVVLFIIMCIVVIVLVVRNGMLQSQLYGDEDDEYFDDLIAARAKRDAEAKVAQEKAAGESADADGNTVDGEPKKKISKNVSYGVSDDTGEILLEEALDNNAGVNVPPAEDVDKSKIKDEMDKKPFGIDSAFAVASPDEAPEGDHVYVEPEPKKFIDLDKLKSMAVKIKDSITEPFETIKNVEAPEEEDDEAEEAEEADAAETIADNVKEAKSEETKPEETEESVVAENKSEAETKNEVVSEVKEEVAGDAEPEVNQPETVNDATMFIPVEEIKEQRSSKKKRKNRRDRRKSKKFGFNKQNEVQEEAQDSKVSSSDNNQSDNKEANPVSDKESKKVVLPGQVDEEEE